MTHQPRTMNYADKTPMVVTMHNPETGAIRTIDNLSRYGRSNSEIMAACVGCMPGFAPIGVKINPHF